LKKDDIVKYIGTGHTILEKNKEYKIFSCNKTDVQVHMKTGFCGVPVKDVILVKIGE